MHTPVSYTKCTTCEVPKLEYSILTRTPKETGIAEKKFSKITNKGSKE